MFVLALRTNLRTILHAILRAILVDLHACKFPHVTSTRVELVRRVNLHAWKKWVRAWRGGLINLQSDIAKIRWKTMIQF